MRARGLLDVAAACLCFVLTPSARHSFVLPRRLATFLVCQGAYWMPVYGAKHWFKGPVNETNVQAWVKEGNRAEDEPRA